MNAQAVRAGGSACHFGGASAEQLRQLQKVGSVQLSARARMAALLGDAPGALQLLREAVGEQGIDLHADMDLDSLKNNREFQEFLRPKG